MAILIPDSVPLVPGNDSYSMGIGRLGGDDIIMQRKFRFLFSIDFCGGTRTVPPHYVKTAGKPGVTIEDTEIDFLNEKTWVPGKVTYDDLTITYLQVSSGIDQSNIALWDWLATVYNYLTPSREMNSKRREYAGNGTLAMLDGCGHTLEVWQMRDMWPTGIKFGDTDYNSSDFMEIELTMRYSQISYQNFCGRQPVRCPCSPC